MDERDPEQVPGDPQRQARAGAHPRAAPVVPADRHDRQPVAAPAGEVDQLDVEHDARDLLAGEQVVRGRAREALEPALRVLDRPDDPDRGEEVERLAEQAPVARLASRACPSRRAGSATRARRRGRSSAATSSGSWSGGVAMSASAKTTRSAVGGEHPGPDRGALAAVRDAQDTQVAPSGPAPGSPRVGPRRGRRCRPCCRRRRRGRRSRSGSSRRTGRPVAARAGRAGARYPNSSSSAGPIRSASL